MSSPLHPRTPSRPASVKRDPRTSFRPKSPASVQEISLQLTVSATCPERASTFPLSMSHAPATSTSFQASVLDLARATNNTLKPLRFKSWLPPPTLSTTKFARQTAANAPKLLMPLLPSRPRTEPSPSRVPSPSSREFTSPRERELPRTPRVYQRSKLSALPTIRTVVSVLINSASQLKFAHQASMLSHPDPFKLAELPLQFKLLQ